MIKQAIAGLMLVIPTSASAAEFGTTTGFETGRKYITLTGDIKPGDSRQLYMFALLNQDATHVAFNSPGGEAQEGYQIGHIMSQLGLSSYVGFGQHCLSSCYTAFLGGTDYEIDGVLGAHVAWYPEDELEEDQTVSDILRYGQGLGGYDAFWHMVNGFGYELQWHIADKTDQDTFITFTDESQLMKFFKRSDDEEINDYFSFSNDAPTVTEAHDMFRLAFGKFDERWPNRFDPRKEEKD